MKLAGIRNSKFEIRKSKTRTENCKRRTPPSWGEKGGVGDILLAFLFVVVKGKRKFENDAVNWNAEDKLFGFLVAFEPDRA